MRAQAERAWPYGSGMNDLPENVRQWVGRPVVVVEDTITVERESWLTFCSAVGDANALYWSEEAAGPFTHGVIAPPAMLPGWGTQRDWDPTRRESPMRPLELHFMLKEAMHYPHGIVTEVELEWHEPVRAGDSVRTEQVLREIGAEQSTRLGPGRRWTIDVVYRRRDQVLLGIQSLQFLAYRRAPDTAGSDDGR